jgi:hypothetical protein
MFSYNIRPLQAYSCHDWEVFPRKKRHLLVGIQSVRILTGSGIGEEGRNQHFRLSGSSKWMTDLQMEKT